MIQYQDRPYGLRWKRADGSTREITSGCTRRRDAERAAAELEIDLAENNPDSPNLSWTLFCQRYLDEHVEQLSEGSKSAWTTTRNWVDKTVKPRRLAELNKSMLSRFQAELRKSGLAETSIRTYLSTLLAALGWACDVDLLGQVPRVRLPRQAGSKHMRSRPITEEEYERILMCCPKVRPHDHQQWDRFIQGLWHSGLRVDELRRLSWDLSAELAIDTTHEIPLIRMQAGGHKARRDEYQPITPDFWKLIELPPPDRQGYVFQFSCARKSKQITRKSCIRIVSSIGSKAGVITDTATGKKATSHDIGRRAFLTRMDKLLSIAELQKWARHKSPQTTMAFYHHRTAIELGRKVWSAS